MATRSFIDFDGTATFATLTNAVTFAGNFELELDFATTNTASQMLVGGTLAGTNEIRIEIDASGFASFYAYVGTTLQTAITGAAALDDGKLHHIKVTYTGTTAELFVNSVSIGTQTWSLNGAQDIVLLGKISTGTFTNGTIANVRFTDLVTPANDLFFPLSEATLDHEISGTAGAELWTDPPTNLGTQWTDNTGGSYSYAGDGTFNSLWDSSITTVGNVYEVSFTVDSISNDTMKLADGNAILAWTTTGVKTARYVANQVSPQFSRATTVPINCTISGITFKEIDNSAELTSVTRWTGTDSGSDWEGIELVTNGGFATDTSWTKGTGWTIAATVADSDGTQGADSDLTQTAVVSGNVYTTTYTSTRSAGNSTVLIGTTEGTDRTTGATYTETVTAAGTLAGIRADVNFVGTIDDFSVKRFLENANALAALSGTVTTSITEADIQAGGDTIIIQLTGDTFLAAGTAFDDQRQAIIDGLNGV